MSNEPRALKKLSIVVPVYYNEENLRPLYDDLKAKVLDKVAYDYELVLVDDGSGDGSWEKIQELAGEDVRIVALRLSRNFGSHAALLCGLAHSTGECAVMKAADLQEPSEMIHEMVERWQAGDNVVLALREDREESRSQTFFANFYYWMVRKTALPTMPKGGFDISLLDRKVIDVLDKMDEKNSALTGQILWSGFKTGRVYYTRKEREIGKSRWTMKKKLRLVTDTLFSFSTLPITLVMAVGGLSFVGSLLWALVVLAFWAFGSIPVQGWTTLFIFNLFSFGVVMLTLGVLGGYLWRAFDASRGRPLYIVEEHQAQGDPPKKNNP